MWSELPYDMLALISKALALGDFIIFSSVCRSWRLVYSTTKHDHRNETPWLMYGGGEDEPNAANFYNISNKKKLKIGNQPGPCWYNRKILGSAHGWVITADDKSQLSLVNPVTRQQIDLPAVTTFGHFRPVEHDANGEITHYLYRETEYKRFERTYKAEKLRHGFYTQATLTHSPGLRDDYTVVIILCQLHCIAFARCGDTKWTTLPHENYRQDISCDDEGKVYTITDWSGIVESWDFSKKNNMPEPTIYLPQDQKLSKLSCEYMFYFVHTPWGDTLSVRRRRKGSYKAYLTRKIWIYKVDSQSKKLLPIKSIGDYVLFLGGSQPLCISCKNDPNLRPNSVYFTDEDFEKSTYQRRIPRDIGVYSLDDGSVQRIMPHNSLLNWPPPIFLQPALF